MLYRVFIRLARINTFDPSLYLMLFDTSRTNSNSDSHVPHWLGQLDINTKKVYHCFRGTHINHKKKKKNL